MSGIKLPTPRRPRPPGDTNTDCDFKVVTTLQSTRASELATINPGESLPVCLVNDGGYRVVACVHPATGKVVGSLAGIPGIGRLIKCIENGESYAVDVVLIQGGHCEVFLHKVFP